MPTYSKNIRTNVLELACTHASLDIANYLINDIKIDLKQYMTRSDGKDLIHSTLNLINDDTVYLLDLILSNTLYDFNQTFPMSYEADISPNADNSIKDFFKQKTNLQGLIEQRKVWSSVLGIKQEKVDRQYNKIFKTIEKHQLNQTMNKEEFNQQIKNIKKQKI